MIDNIVLNIPHSSVEGLTDRTFGHWSDFTEFLKEVRTWTDWYTDLLFIPSISNTERIRYKRFDKSRFVLDVERLINDPLEEEGQGIIYTRFGNFKRHLDDEARNLLMKMYADYIHCFEQLIDENSLLIDCHSFPSHLSDCDICIGVNDDWSTPSDKAIDFVVKTFERFGYKVSINAPYSNSLTPVMYVEYKSFMIEVNKRIYMNEHTLTLNPEWHILKTAIETLYKELTSGAHRF